MGTILPRAGGFLDASKRGVWSLTEKGHHAQITLETAAEIIRSVGSMLRETDGVADGAIAPENTDGRRQSALFASHQSRVLEIMRSLPPAGFERLCQRLLRESGFAEVQVTGRTGDGGIDGHGILQVNPLVSFRVLFQCKRYAAAVAPKEIRDFRGAMAGRSDKGIFLTTATFSPAAVAEASRDGVPPIELVDGEALVRMFERLELGLKPVTAYEVDDDFFADFRSG